MVETWDGVVKELVGVGIWANIIKYSFSDTITNDKPQVAFASFNCADF